MTALPRYALLEAVGSYAETPGAAPREVVLCFGDAALTILGPDDVPLAHWPLATLALVAAAPAPGGEALTLAPDADAPERLVVADPTMTAALREDRAGLAAAPPAVAPARAPRRARLPRALLVAAALLGLGAALWQAGPSLREAAARAAPQHTRAAIGDAAAQILAGGRFCRPGLAARPALDAVARIARAMGAGPAPVALRIADGAGPAGALAVVAPGGRVILFRPALEALAAPDALVDGLALALARDEVRSPLPNAARASAPRAALDDLRAILAAVATGAAPSLPRLAEATAAEIAAAAADASPETQALAAVLASTAREGGLRLDGAALAAARSACGGS